MSSNYELYKKFEEYRKKNKITYSFLAKELKTSAGAIHDKITRLKNNKSVHTGFLIELEKIFKHQIFFKK